MTRNLSFLRRFVLGALALAAAPALLLSTPVSAQSAPSRVFLAAGAMGNPQGPQALAAADSGLVPSSQRVSLTLTLTPDPARAAALDQYLAALTTPSSPSYREWLTPAQFAASYGATAAQLSAVAAWAQDAGLTLDAISPAANRVTVSGSAALVQTAFATSLHLYQIDARVYYAAATRPSLPAAAAQLFTAVEGLDNLPGSSPLGDFPALTAQVDANASPVLVLSGSAVSAAQLPEYTQLFRQAAAQGITTLLPAAAGTFADATALADASAQAATATPRPTWQAAPGLPADNFRDTPDLTVGSLSTFTQTLGTLVAGGRLGNIAPVLYTLAPAPGIFTQADGASAGTWEAGSGLGLVDPVKFAAAFPRGGGQSFASFSSTNYSPTHGQGTSFTSMVTSGTGGATPTGTVSFTTSTGQNLGTAPLVGGSATLSINSLAGGNYILQAVYSGDATYASSVSPTSQIYVGPEPSQLSAAVTGTPSVGSNYTVTVTDAASYGSPNGPVTLTVSGSSVTQTQTLAPASSTSSTAIFSVPATAPGGITLSINCTGNNNYSCSNPLTTTVQIAKATPVLSISYTPNPVVSGQQVALNAVVTTVGSAPAPTGNVRFFDNGTTLNAAALSGGSASTTGTVPQFSSHSITATYDGDPNYNTVSTAAGSSSSGTISTTLALTSSATQVNAGANITFTAALTPASTGPANPSGTVQFFDGGSSLGTANLSGNAASLTVNTLSSTSSHTITAIYSGDAYYTTSSSNPVTLAGGASSNTTTTTLTASSLGPVHGSNVTFTATVAPPTGGAVPAGTVTFTSQQTGQLGQATLVNGQASFTTRLLPGGISMILATYNGGAPYNPSTSGAVTISVSPEPTITSISVPSSGTYGSPFNVFVAVLGSSGVGAPSGTVTVQPTGSGYTTASTAQLVVGVTGSNSGVGLTLQATAAGSIILSASYAGDANFAASGPISNTLSIGRAASTVVLNFSPNPIVAGQPTVVTAKVATTGGTAPTGSIQFHDGSTIFGTVPLDATGTASYTITFPAGSQILYAVYSGDANYQPGTSASTNTSTGTLPSNTALTITPATVVLGGSVTLSAAVGPSNGNVAPTGMVQFLSGNTVLCTATLGSSVGSCTISPSAVGGQNIVASYLGDGQYAPSVSAGGFLNVTNGNGSLSATVSPTSAMPNTSATITATVTAPAGVVPTGSVTATLVNAGGVVQNTYTVPLAGGGTSSTAIVSIPFVAPLTNGTYIITVACVNTNFTCSNTVSLPFVVGAAPSGSATLTAAVTPATAQPGATATVTGTITAATGTTLSGTITATLTNAAGTAVAGAVYSITQPATAVTTSAYSIPISVPTTAGIYTVTVTCTSSAFTCAPVTTTVTSSTTALIPTTTTLVAALSGTATGAINLTASVATAAAGTTAPSGSITFYDGTTAVGIAVVGSTGKATISLTQNTTVTHSYTAVYSGDTVYAASTSPAVSGTSASTPAAITLTASTASAISGSNVVLTAQVTGITLTGTAPTGTVSFYIVGASARLLGTATLTPQGSGASVAVLTTTGLPPGTLTIDAVYSGDTNFTTVTSNTVTIGLSDFSVTFSPPTLTIIRGGSGLTTATVNFLGGLTGVVALACTPAADSDVTCSFSPSSVSANGTSTLTIQTSSPRAALTPPATLRTGLLGGISFAALLCLLLPGRKRRRLPTLLLFVFSLGMVAATTGCGQNNFNSPLSASGSPLGTTILTITAAGASGTSTVRHTYYYQVTIE